MTAREMNLDGLVGPSHNYGGLAYGNVASEANAAAVSNPREAALQGLAKMQRIHDMGLLQAVLPPQERPDVQALRQLGFDGDDHQVIAAAARQAPGLLAACSSASSMWAANAATVSPSADTADGRVHFTPANLVGNFHRSIEPATTGRLLRSIFPDGERFAHHQPLPPVALLGDEGAANHTRLCEAYGNTGIEVFVHGRTDEGAKTGRYPARQSRAAGEAIARLHGLDPQRCFFLRQNPAAIEAGVFHNDVIAVGNQNVLFQHELAYVDDEAVMHSIDAALDDAPLHRIVVPASRVSLQESVRTYLFNSQLVTLPDGGMALVLPAECRESRPVRDYLEDLLASQQPMDRLEFLDVRQSMRNGGGPACLRLRVVLDERERRAMAPGVLWDGRTSGKLMKWVQRHYRDRLSASDLADPSLLDECRTALDELTALLGLGSVYPFQLDHAGTS